jgi:hypothetical protein
LTCSSLFCFVALKLSQQRQLNVAALRATRIAGESVEPFLDDPWQHYSDSDFLAFDRISSVRFAQAPDIVYLQNEFNSSLFKNL